MESINTNIKQNTAKIQPVTIKIHNYDSNQYKCIAHVYFCSIISKELMIPFDFATYEPINSQTTTFSFNKTGKIDLSYWRAFRLQINAVESIVVEWQVLDKL